MQLSIEARQLIHQRYERQSVSQVKLSVDFQSSHSTVIRILTGSRDDPALFAGSGIPGKSYERVVSALPNIPNKTPMLFCANMPTKL